MRLNPPSMSRYLAYLAMPHGHYGNNNAPSSASTDPPQARFSRTPAIVVHKNMLDAMHFPVMPTTPSNLSRLVPDIAHSSAAIKQASVFGIQNTLLHAC